MDKSPDAQDKPVDSRCAVRDLPTAPRFGAFGLTR